LQPPDSLHLRAAQGWLELGSVEEAKGELANLSVTIQNHPDVIELRWAICAAEKRWEPAVELADALIKTDPDEPAGWVHRSYALHELKRTEEARDNLLKIVDKFSDSPTIRYNLACYECQLGNLDEARKWLERAFRLGDRKRMKPAALQDLDLKPLWPEIEGKEA
jgi:tetratricopeptide (TPR) repeat protein